MGPARRRVHIGAVALLTWSVFVLTPAVDASATLQSAPSVQCLPSPLDLGSVIIGDPPSSGTVTCTNNGRVRATITAVQTTGPNASDFTPTATACLRTLSPGDSCQIPISFAPGGAGARTAQLQITIAQSPSGPVVVELRGTGVTRETPPVEQPDTTLTFEPSSLAFADQLGLTTSPAQTVTVSNIGTVPVTIGGTTVEGNAPADFAVATSSCAAALPPGGSCQIAVAFTPQAPGPRAASLRIDHNGEGAPHLMPLSGAGATPAILVSPTVGRAGDVATAGGVSFPPGQIVTLQWVDPDAGGPAGFPEPVSALAVGADGTFTIPLLLFPKSPVGPRVLHASVGVFVADGSLLVAPGSVQGPDFVVRA